MLARHVGLAVALSVALATHGVGQTLHAITGSERDPKLSLGNCVVLDEENFIRFLRSHVPAKQLVIHRLSQDQLTPAGVVSAIRKVQVGPKDSILYYSSTHGAWDDKVGHFIDFGPRGALPRSVIRKELSAKGARLAVVITDCCGSLKRADLESLEGAGITVRVKAVPAAESLAPVAKSLFFDASGLVDITSCSRGEASVGYDDNGSLFTLLLLKLLRERGNGIRDWDDLFKRLHRITIENFKVIEKGGIDNSGREGRPNQFQQTPTAFALPGKGRLTPDVDPRATSSTPAGRSGLGVRVGARAGRGVVVVEVFEGSLAKKMGLVAGDVLLSVGNRRTDTLAEFSDAMDRAGPRDDIEVQRKSDGRVVRIGFKRK